MKLIFFTIFVVCLSSCATNNKLTDTQPQVVWKAGLFEVGGCEDIEIHGDYMSARRNCETFALVDETSSVKIELGINFGIEYLITPRPGVSCFKETRILEHPPILQPNGKITTSYSRNYWVGDCPDAVPFGSDMFTWNIGEDWEAVTGKWIFKVLFDEHVVAYKEFHAY